jgi:RNA polymerase-binding transcription factor DksA
MLLIYGNEEAFGSRTRLTQLDRALTEINDEGYGACQRCGQRSVGRA